MKQAKNQRSQMVEPLFRLTLRDVAAKIIQPRLRPWEAARRQPAVRWAAAPIALSCLWHGGGVEEAPGRRPGARRPYPAGDPLGAAGFRRGSAPEGHSRGRRG